MLNRRQIMFVLEYLTDLNATQAAIRAGYSERTAYAIGHKLLKNAEVKSAIENAMSRRAKRTEITADAVIQELAAVGFARVDEYLSWGQNGLELKTSQNLTSQQLSAVSEVSETPNRHGKVVRFKLHDKLRALELLGQHLGIFKVADRSDPTLLEKMYEEMVKGVPDYDGGTRPEDKN